MEFKDKLKKLRTENGLTQEALAEAIHVSRSAIAKYENGNGYPSKETLESLAYYFGVDISELESDEIIVKRKKKKNIIKIILIVFSSIIGAIGLGLAGFAIYFELNKLPTGGMVEFNASKIGLNACKEMREITLHGHTFTYYNVKSNEKGEWILVDETSHIINTDIIFGFRLKSGDKVSINGYYNDEAEIYNNVSKAYPGYTDYSIRDYGFIIEVKDDTEVPPEGINLGIMMHWC